jgi:hypothetical protein
LNSCICSIVSLLAFAANIWIIDWACHGQFINLGYRAEPISNAVRDVFPVHVQCNTSRIEMILAVELEYQIVDCIFGMGGWHQELLAMLWYTYAAIGGLSLVVIYIRFMTFIAMWFKCGRR